MDGLLEFRSHENYRRNGCPMIAGGCSRRLHRSSSARPFQLGAQPVARAGSLTSIVRGYLGAGTQFDIGRCDKGVYRIVM